MKNYQVTNPESNNARIQVTHESGELLIPVGGSELFTKGQAEFLQGRYPWLMVQPVEVGEDETPEKESKPSKKDKEAKEAKEVEVGQSYAQLKEEAIALGLEVKGNPSRVKLQEMVDEAKEASVDPDETPENAPQE